VKVGDKVRGIKGNYSHRVGQIGTVDGFAPGGDVYVMWPGEKFSLWSDVRCIELVDETPASDTTSADAFARIIAILNDALNAMLASDDYDKAIEYAIMMRECERMRDD